MKVDPQAIANTIWTQLCSHNIALAKLAPGLSPVPGEGEQLLTDEEAKKFVRNIANNVAQIIVLSEVDEELDESVKKAAEGD